ncbi:DUF6479 family protein [Streptomyces sp. NPDC046977]|uniref:DUF6479 family protein n=1 Tax=Streptomyces sp. NPDC046977 TaxID=3154703 RepID=UPI0033DB310E
MNEFQLAVAHDLVVGIVPLLVGVIVVGILVGAVVLGRRHRARQPAPAQRPQPRAGAWHTRDEHETGRSPDHGPGHQDGIRHGIRQRREPDEWSEPGFRRRQHSMKGFGNFGSHAAGDATEAPPQDPRRDRS